MNCNGYGSAAQALRLNLQGSASGKGLEDEDDGIGTQGLLFGDNPVVHAHKTAPGPGKIQTGKEVFYPCTVRNVHIHSSERVIAREAAG